MTTLNSAVKSKRQCALHTFRTLDRTSDCFSVLLVLNSKSELIFGPDSDTSSGHAMPRKERRIAFPGPCPERRNIAL